MSVYIIAEAGVNHNGKLDLALKLCDAAKEAGVDAVKFQTWKTENIVTASARQAAYQTENTGKEESQYDMLKGLELSYDHFRTIQDYCKKIGMLVTSPEPTLIKGSPSEIRNSKLSSSSGVERKSIPIFLQ